MPRLARLPLVPTGTRSHPPSHSTRTSTRLRVMHSQRVGQDTVQALPRRLCSWLSSQRPAQPPSELQDPTRPPPPAHDPLTLPDGPSG